MQKYKNISLSYEERAQDLLSIMTLKEKVGQIAQPFKAFLDYEIQDGQIILSDKLKNFITEFGGLGTMFSFFRADPWSGRTFDNGITIHERERAYNTLQKFVIENTRLGIPVMFEENAPHGLQVLDSVMYPTSLGIGATFDREAFFNMEKCIGQECQSFGIHVPNTSLFDMACDPRFGRTEECLSEDPYLSSQMCGSAVRGIKAGGAMICCKHFCGQGAGIGGHCGGVTNIGERELREIHLPAVKEAVDNGADFIMASYNDIDGVRCHTNSHILTDILQNEFGFNGVIRADRMGVDFDYDLTKSAAIALNAGIMLGLGETAFTRLEEAVEKGYTSVEKIDQAVFKILKKKFECGVMDNPYIPEAQQSQKFIASGVSQKAAYDCASKSLVLLKNDNHTLPLKKPLHLAVFGEHADSIYPILGDYTPPQRVNAMPTIFMALQKENTETFCSKGWDFFDDTSDFDNAMQIAEKSDVIVVCLGGSSARDFSGVYNDKGQTVATKSNFMDCGEGRDVCDLHLPGNQLKFLHKLKEIGKPIVSLMIQGRPYIMDEVISVSDAVVIVWYPGQEGPHAIADALFGATNCFGRLPVSIPNASGALPVYYNHRPMQESYIDLEKLSDFPFGSGINYSHVIYDNLCASGDYSAEDIKNGARFTITIDATNDSDLPVDEVVMLFIHAYSVSIIRRVKELKGFERVKLNPHETKSVTFTLSKKELEILDVNNEYTVEPAKIQLFAGGNIQNMKQCFISIEPTK